MVEDPLKPLDEVLVPDGRSVALNGTLEDRHRLLSEIVLSASVPTDVQQLFETAKNVALYAWFVYRFHQVAESVAFQALEMGLRKRREQAQGRKAKNNERSLSLYFKFAVESGWIRNEGFSDLRDIARARAFTRMVIATIERHPGVEIMPLPQLSEADIDVELGKLSYVESLTTALPTIRNELAHGSRMLHPNSAKTLRVVAEMLNQVFDGAPGKAE